MIIVNSPELYLTQSLMFCEGVLKHTQKRKWCSSFVVKFNDYSLQPTTGLKISLQIFIWNCSESIKLRGITSRFYRLLKKSLHIISNAYLEKLLFWKFRENPGKKIFKKIPFQQLELSSLSSLYTIQAVQSTTYNW